MSKDFILASASDSRLNLLMRIGMIPTRVIGMDVDEAVQRHETPMEMALRLSKEKAMALLRQHEINDAIVLAADSVVSRGRRIVDKALNDNDVEQCMNTLSGRNHRVYSAFCVIKIDINGAIMSTIHKIAETRIKFKHLTDLDIDAMLATKEGIGKAGGYDINGIAETFIVKMIGQVSTVIGMPTYQVRSALMTMGLKSKFQLSRSQNKNDKELPSS